MKPRWLTCLVRSTLTVLLLMLSSPISAKTIYVDANAPGPNTGTSWADAYRFLQDALSDADSSPKPVEIRVAQGTYRPDRTSAEPNATQNQRPFFQLMSSVTLKGAYAGFGQQDPNARDIDLYQTILSGDFDLPSQPCSPCDYSEYVVDGSDTDRTAVLDGFHIIGGRYAKHCNPRGATTQVFCGSGIRNNSGSPTVINCTFTGNRYGVYNSNGSSPLFVDCRFIDNPIGDGAAMNSTDSHPEIMRCVFENNSSSSGSVIYSRKGTLTATKCRFSYNQAVAIYSDQSHLSLTACQFDHNRTGGNGTAAYIRASSVADFNDCVFFENESNLGGCLYAEQAILTVSGCIFRSNSATTSGGAIYSTGQSGSLIASKSVFHSNSAVSDGGAIILGCLASINNCTFEVNASTNGGAIDNSANNLTLAGCLFTGNRAMMMTFPTPGQAYGMGGAIFNMGNNISLSNCTFAANEAFYGSAISSQACTPPTVTIRNSIVWDKYAFYRSGKWNITFSNIRDTFPGDGNISVDPCFVKPGYWDPNGTILYVGDDFWVDGDYHLKSQAGRWDRTTQTWIRDAVTSPCIDAGNPMSPIGNEPFPNGGRINMGAYGGTAEASKSYFSAPVCETIIPGDINSDCVVDFHDFTLLALHWLQDSNNDSPHRQTIVAGDINSDRKVDLIDLSVMSDHWLSTSMAYDFSYLLETARKSAIIILGSYLHLFDLEQAADAFVAKHAGPSALQFVTPLTKDLPLCLVSLYA